VWRGAALVYDGGPLMRRRPTFLLPLLLAAGCHVQSPASTSFPSNGAALVVSGGSLVFAADQAAVLVGTASCTPAGVSPYELAWAEVLASDEPRVCELLAAGEEQASRLSLRIVVGRTGAAGSGVALTPGTHLVAAEPGGAGADPWATVALVAAGADCGLEAIPAADGAVELRTVEAGHLQGTVTAHLVNGSTVTGTFGVDVCAAPSTGDACAGAPGPASPTCVP
jgi:hypothetical protein